MTERRMARRTGSNKVGKEEKKWWRHKCEQTGSNQTHWKTNVSCHCELGGVCIKHSTNVVRHREQLRHKSNNTRPKLSLTGRQSGLNQTHLIYIWRNRKEMEVQGRNQTL